MATSISSTLVLAYFNSPGSIYHEKPSRIARKLKVKVTSPFAKIDKDAAPAQPAGWDSIVLANEEWGGKVVTGELSYEAVFDSSTTITAKCGAHSLAATVAMVDAESAPTLALVLHEGGRPSIVSSGGGIAIDVDVDGNPVWEVVPTDTIRLISDIGDVSGGLRSVTYTVENLTDVALWFQCLDLVLPGFPSGWTGVVGGEDSVSFVLSFPESESVYQQLTQFNSHEDGSDERTNNTVGRIYVPASRLTFQGINTITSAIHNSTLSRNEIALTVSLPASRLALYRVTPAGTSLVSVTDGAFVPSTTYTLIDEDFTVGVDNTYWIAAGRGSNYCVTLESGWATIEN